MNIRSVWQRRAHGFTLIELLIVIAIMAIMSAASLVVVSGPLQEQAFATIDHARQAGESALFARLVEDAHTASRVVSSQPGSLVLETAGASPRTITYIVDEQKQLRRHAVAVGDSTSSTISLGASLLENVETFSAEPVGPENDRYRVRLTCSTTKYARKLGDQHELIIGVGSKAWSGEVR